MRTENGQVVETAVEARGGFLDRPILAVLIVGTMLAVGLLAAILIVFFVW